MNGLGAAQTDDETYEKIRRFTHRMRKNIIELGFAARAGNVHFGGGLSIVDIVGTLFCSVMKLDPRNPEWPERDRFILSKGHGVLGYYTALHEAGLLTHEELMNFEKPGSPLLGHPVMNRAIGIEFSTGSLGMGLSLGIGVALAARRRQKNFKVFVLLGDGECNEGSVWEAAMAAPHFQLSQMTAIIDRNSLQQTGSGKEILDLGDMAAKWASFGWETREVDGHDIPALHTELTRTRNAQTPLALIAHTIKGKGFSEMENNNSWHHASLTQAQYSNALSELESKTKSEKE